MWSSSKSTTLRTWSLSDLAFQSLEKPHSWGTIIIRPDQELTSWESSVPKVFVITKWWQLFTSTAAWSTRLKMSLIKNIKGRSRGKKIHKRALKFLTYHWASRGTWRWAGSELGRLRSLIPGSPQGSEWAESES